MKIDVCYNRQITRHPFMNSQFEMLVGDDELRRSRVTDGLVFVVPLIQGALAN